MIEFTEIGVEWDLSRALIRSAGLRPSISVQCRGGTVPPVIFRDEVPAESRFIGDHRDRLLAPALLEQVEDAWKALSAYGRQDALRSWSDRSDPFAKDQLPFFYFTRFALGRREPFVQAARQGREIYVWVTALARMPGAVARQVLTRGLAYSALIWRLDKEDRRAWGQIPQDIDSILTRWEADTSALHRWIARHQAQINRLIRHSGRRSWWQI